MNAPVLMTKGTSAGKSEFAFTDSALLSAMEAHRVKTQQDIAEIDIALDWIHPTEEVSANFKTTIIRALNFESGRKTRVLASLHHLIDELQYGAQPQVGGNAPEPLSALICAHGAPNSAVVFLAQRPPGWDWTHKRDEAHLFTKGSEVERALDEYERMRPSPARPWYDRGYIAVERAAQPGVQP